MKSLSYIRWNDIILETLTVFLTLTFGLLNWHNPLLGGMAIRIFQYPFLFLLFFLTVIDHQTPFLIMGWLSDHWRFILLLAAVLFFFQLLPSVRTSFSAVPW